MSEPIRYTQAIKCVEPSYYAQDICSGMVECSIGEWVLHSDYARLKAEVEELQRLLTASTYYNTSDEVTRLKAEVERLTKAGDAMLSEWASGDEKDAKNFLKALVIWNAAKEGKQL